VASIPGAHEGAGAHASPSTIIPAGHEAGAPTHAERVLDQSCPAQQQCPRVSSLVDIPAAHAHVSPVGRKDGGQAVGMPTHAERALDQTCPG
jgi:hypothetical protein